MIRKMPIGVFVEGLRECLRRGDGYIMGATGQDPKAWKVTSWWFTQYEGSQKEAALRWRETAARVWDCNGLAEGLYKDFTGVDINTKARYNYGQWCDPKGEGMIPAEYRVPGAAVFWSETGAGDIHHVAYLVEPVTPAKPDGDWYMIEARGVKYGVVRTKLGSRKPNYWGWMTKYFDYAQGEDEHEAVETPVEAPAAAEALEPVHGMKLLKKGAEGAQVRTLQRLLNAVADAGLEVDGDFGSATKKAVTAYQSARGLEADGQCGDMTWTQLLTRE